MEIKASSIYDMNVVREFAYLNHRTGEGPKKEVTKLLIVSAVVIATAIIAIIAFDFDIFMWIAIAIVIISDLVNAYMYYFIPKRAYKSKSDNETIKNNFIFYDDGFEGFLSEKGFTGSAQVKYDTLFQIIESKKYFVIYESKKRAHIIEKNTIRNEELKILKRKLFDEMPRGKYIVKKDW